MELATKHQLCSECGHLNALHVGDKRPLKCTWRDCQCQCLTVSLTPREMEILKLMAFGVSLKGQATALGIATKTVECHRYGLMRKLRLDTAAKVMMFALKNRIVSLEELPDEGAVANG